MSRQIRKQVGKIEENLPPLKAGKLRNKLLSSSPRQAILEIADLEKRDNQLLADLLNKLNEIELKQIDNHIGENFSLDCEMPKSKKELRNFFDNVSILCIFDFKRLFN